MSGDLRVVFRDRAFDAEWDGFVTKSPQGSLFSTSWWTASIGNPFRYLTCYLGDELVAGMVCMEDGGENMVPSPAPYTPFQGLLHRSDHGMSRVRKYSTQLKASRAVADALLSKYGKISFTNHWSLEDIRGFTWSTYGNETDRQFETTVYYTSVIDICDQDRFVDRAKSERLYDVRKAARDGVKVDDQIDLHTVLSLREQTFGRQDIEISKESTELFLRLFRSCDERGRLRRYVARTKGGEAASVVLMVTDEKTGYYLWAFNAPGERRSQGGSLAVWRALEDLHCQGYQAVDMVGENSPHRSRFKRQFGGELKHYFRLEVPKSAGTAG